MSSTAAGKGGSVSLLSQKRLRGGLELRSSVARRVKTVSEGVNKEEQGRMSGLPYRLEGRETSVSVLMSKKGRFETKHYGNPGKSSL